MKRSGKIFAFIFIAASAAISGTQVCGQNLVGTYNRNGLSVIVVERGEFLDREVSGVVGNFDWGGKFDMNSIPTTSVNVRVSRGNSISPDRIGEALSDSDVGKEILAYIFQRSDDGMMNDSIVRFRGAYNATDQDVINARASAVGVAALGDRGYALVNSSYVMVLDFYNVREEQNSDREEWTARANAYAYKISMTPDRLDDFLEKCWIYDDDSEEVRARKLKNFREYQVVMTPVATTSSYGSGGSAGTAIASACGSSIVNLENLIPQWNVATTIYSKRPLMAKIGTKEGLKPGNRYRAYSYREDAEGHLITVKRGYLRATDVAENRTVSTGKSAMSRFYQISGAANIQEGWSIKQSNDAGIGLMLGAKYGGVATGGYSVYADVDFLAAVTRRGDNAYVMLSIGGDVTNGTGNFFGAVGAGFGMHVSRFVEVAPYLMLGQDYLSYSGTSTESSYGKKLGFVLEPGVRVAVNLAYPLQLVVKGCYDWIFSKGILYQESMVKAKHDSGFGLSAGLKWTF